MALHCLLDLAYKYLITFSNFLSSSFLVKSIAPQNLGGNSISGYCPPERQYRHLAVVDMNCSFSSITSSKFWCLLVLICPDFCVVNC
jgi:hypothetical protein